MNSDLNLLQSKVRTAEVLREAREHRIPAASEDRLRDAVVRLAGEADGAALERLAQLEGRRLSPGPALVAEQEGEVLAAVSIAGGAPIADPFRPTAELVELLGRALAHLRGEGGRRRWRLWGALRRSNNGGRSPSAPTVPGNEFLLIR